MIISYRTHANNLFLYSTDYCGSRPFWHWSGSDLFIWYGITLDPDPYCVEYKLSNIFMFLPWFWCWHRSFVRYRTIWGRISNDFQEFDKSKFSSVIYRFRIRSTVDILKPYPAKLYGSGSVVLYLYFTRVNLSLWFTVRPYSTELNSVFLFRRNYHP
jgi:hypothetical protein